MEYRGIEYAVVQTIENDWRWSVKRAPKDKVGKSSHRETAIFRAQQFIDGLIKLRSNERTEAIDNGKTPARWI